MEKGWNTSWVDTPWTSKLSSWPEDIPVHRVADEVGGIAAGDCAPPRCSMLWRVLAWLWMIWCGAGIIFSEKLKHGTCPWEGKGERRTLFYK